MLYYLSINTDSTINCSLEEVQCSILQDVLDFELKA